MKGRTTEIGMLYKDIGGLAVDPRAGKLFGVLAGVLYEIDKAAARTTEFIRSEFEQTLSLASDPLSGLLFSTGHLSGHRGDQQLITMDAYTTIADTIGPIGGLGCCIGMDFHPSTGVLYGVNGDGELITIDTSSGAVSVVGSTGFQFVNSLVFVPIVPEPSVYLMVGICSVCFFTRRRIRQ